MLSYTFQMSRSTKKYRKIVRAVATFAGAILGLVWLRTLATVDPFANLRKQPEISSTVGIRLMDVDIWHYSDNTLKTKARVARVDVRQDRQYLDLYDLTDGVYNSDKGSFNFAAAHAAWNAATRRIEVDSGGRVFAKDFDLKVSSFFLEGESAILRVPGPITGRLYDGNVRAVNLTYMLANGNYSVGPASWEGMLAMPLQDQDPNPKRTRWKIKSDGVVTHVGDIDRWPDGEATDEEVLVKADMVERNTKTDVITATGKVRYFSGKTNMTCEKAVIYRKEKRAVFTGDVHMYFKPKDEQDKPLMVVEIPPFRPMVPEEVSKERPPAPPINDEEKKQDDELRSADLKKYPVTALSSKVEYWYGKGQRHGIITGNPQANQVLPGGRWRHMWTVKGLYDGEKELLRLVSTEGKKDTRVKTSLGDDLVCTWFEISTKDDDDNWKASGISGDVFPDEDEIPKADTKKGAKPTPKPAPSTTPPTQATKPSGPGPT